MEPLLVPDINVLSSYGGLTKYGENESWEWFKVLLLTETFTTF